MLWLFVVMFMLLCFQFDCVYKDQENEMLHSPNFPSFGSRECTLIRHQNLYMLLL